MNDLNWLGTGAFNFIENAAKNKLAELKENNHDCHSSEEMFIRGFYEGMKYLRNALETGLNRSAREVAIAKEKERSHAAANNVTF